MDKKQTNMSTVEDAIKKKRTELKKKGFIAYDASIQVKKAGVCVLCSKCTGSCTNG
jgi:heterodisulfide reductase subunit C